MRKEGLPSFSEESLIEFADIIPLWGNRLVLRGMAEENAELSVSGGHVNFQIISPLPLTQL